MTVPNPYQLREEWRHYCREQKKQQVITDVMVAVSLVVDEAIAKGSTSAFPDYGSPALVAEAMHEGVEAHRRVEAHFAQLAQDAYQAFNTAVQQN